MVESYFPDQKKKLMDFLHQLKKKPFFEHPKKVCMTYATHLKLSLYFSYILGKGSIKAFIHGFIPDTYITSTSDLVQEVDLLLKNNGCHIETKTHESNKSD